MLARQFFLPQGFTLNREREGTKKKQIEKISKQIIKKSISGRSGVDRVDLVAMWGRSGIDPGSIWGGVDPGSIQGRSRSIQGRSSVDPGSIWDRSRIELGSIRDPSRIDPGSLLDRFKIDPESIWDLIDLATHKVAFAIGTCKLKLKAVS